MILYVIGIFDETNPRYYSEKDGIGFLTENIKNAFVFEEETISKATLSEGLFWLPVFFPSLE